jgi:hypothetical protein
LRGTNHLPRDSGLITTDEMPEFLPLRLEKDLADTKVLAEPQARREVMECRSSTMTGDASGLVVGLQ